MFVCVCVCVCVCVLTRPLCLFCIVLPHSCALNVNTVSHSHTVRLCSIPLHQHLDFLIYKGKVSYQCYHNTLITPLRCVPVDLILMQCETTLTCLECGRDNTTLGMNYGEHRDLWCKRCHMKLALYVEQCRFIQHRAGTTVLPTTLQSSGKKRSKKAKEAVIQVGKPLPEFGTCTHYKKSNRWLR